MLNQALRVKQLVVLSGKGGAGKTSVSAALAHLAELSLAGTPPMLVDADVDAANWSLVLQPIFGTANEFWGGARAEIDAELCGGCASCVSVCRYQAVFPCGEFYEIDQVACDGCAACVYACPQGAIRMVPQQDGVWMRSATRFGELFHAELFPGKDNSGKLVTLIKQQARLAAEDDQRPLVIVDGPPGIGCPVISACAGADLGLVVAEPGVSGLHDMKRILGTLSHFRVPAMICINKADLYPLGVQDIRRYAEHQKIPVAGLVPYDVHIPRAMVKGQPVTVAFPESEAARALRELWQVVFERLFPREVEA